VAALDIAKRYLRKGWHPVPIPAKTKGPTGSKWQLASITAQNVGQYFNGRDQNIGVQMGPKSGNLCDVDLDSAEAVKVAPYFLPDTGAVFGRASKPRSHFLYVCIDCTVPINVLKHLGDRGKKDTIVELRLGREKGVQTLFPGSTHPSGEKIEWSDEDDPSEAPLATLKSSIRNIAIASVLLRHWPDSGSRHELSLRVGGFLARAGIDSETIDRIIEAVATEAGDDEVQDRRTAATAAHEAYSNGDRTYGFPALKEAIGAEPAEALARFAEFSEDGSDLPSIKFSPGEASAAATKAEKILIDAKIMYQRGTSLVRPIISDVEASRGTTTKIARLVEIDSVYMKDAIGRHMDFRKFNKQQNKWIKGDVPVDIPAYLVRRSGEWGFPVIAGVITTPTMRSDGTLLLTAGYDESTRLLLVDPPKMPEIAENLKKQDAVKALNFIKKQLTEFVFSQPVDRAVALSAMITPVVRGAFPTTPMHVARAPTPGSGKSYLFDCCAAMAIGQKMPVMSAGIHEEELEKRLGAAMMTGQPLVNIDNVNGELRGDSLCQLIERPNVDLRILGKSQNVTVEARGTSIFCNGNNIVIVGDLCRRVITCTLDTRLERPELREFHGDPFTEIIQNRPLYIAAALTVCRAYIQAGYPGRLPRLASFEGWSDVVRSALVWLGEEDPIETIELARGEDPEVSDLREMIQSWGEVLGVGKRYRRTLADVIKIADEKTPTYSPAWPRLSAALQVVAGRAGDVSPLRLGVWLRGRKGRIVSGLSMASQTPRGTSSAVEWWVDGPESGGQWH
jgi:hypothetical protein